MRQQEEAPDYVALTRARLQQNEPRALDLNGWMPAAVLVLLYPKAGQDTIIFTVRTHTVEHHKGQISFPGGAVHEADRDLEQTAVREAYEEVGVQPTKVEVLGRLDDLVTTTGFRVTPVVAVLRESPYEWIPSPIEVAEVLEVPVAHLLDPANAVDDFRTVAGVAIPGRAYLFNGHRIWGATARMLNSYLALLRGVGGEERPS